MKSIVNLALSGTLFGSQLVHIHSKDILMQTPHSVVNLAPSHITTIHLCLHTISSSFTAAIWRHCPLSGMSFHFFSIFTNNCSQPNIYTLTTPNINWQRPNSTQCPNMSISYDLCDIWHNVSNPLLRQKESTLRMCIRDRHVLQWHHYDVTQFPISWLTQNQSLFTHPL